MQQKTSECEAGTSASSESRYTCLATNRSSESRCSHAEEAVSAVAMHPDNNVNACAAIDANDHPTPAPAEVTNVDTKSRAPALCRVRHAAIAYRNPMSAKGSADDIIRLLAAARGAPIIMPYRGNTATVPMLKSVSGVGSALAEHPRPCTYCRP
jgi:hypothetical protein